MALLITMKIKTDYGFRCFQSFDEIVKKLEVKRFLKTL